ncbi:MAG: hypothetical protein ACT4O2_09890 [Beijerinckiaceae bacterium]
MPQYVGNLVERGHLDRNLESYSFASAEGKEAAIARLVASAEETMENRGIAVATLVMTEDGYGIGSRDLENCKYAHRP